MSERRSLIAGREFRERLLSALPIEQMMQWGSFDEAFLSIVAHHGRPVDINNIFPDAYRDRWIAGEDCDPVADLAALGTAVRRWFPDAFADAGVSLPSKPRFWHAVAGCAMLADWLGSDTDFFPFANGDDPDRMQFSRHQSLRALRDLGIDPSEVRMTGVPTFASVSRHPAREIQMAAGEADGQIVIMESETGSGKTEAALYRFARLFEFGEVDGLYFALLTRVAAMSLYKRVCEAVDRMFEGRSKPAVALAVPGYIGADGVTGRALPGFEVQWDDDPSDAERRARWAAEHPKAVLSWHDCRRHD